jgi:hypothetical protein
MPRGSPAIKLAISVDREVHAKVLRAATEDDMSVSAWMTAAARRALTVREGLVAVEAWEADHGALTAREIEAARERLRPGPRRPGARRNPARRARSV